MSEANFWLDRAGAQKTAKELAQIKNQVEYWEKLETDLKELSEMAGLEDKGLEREL